MAATRILQIINGEFFSGAERVQDVLALRLPDFGYESGFVCIKPDQFPLRRRSTVLLHEVPMRSRFDVRPAFEVARLIRGEGYALVHTHTPRAALIGRLASKIAGVPMVHHVHSPTARDTESSWRNRINALIEKVSLVGVDRLIPVSASLHDYLIDDGWPASRISTVVNGVPTPGPLPDRMPPSGRWTIGCMALYRPRKGIEVLLNAIARLRTEGAPVCLRAVGPFETPEYEREIHGLVRNLGIDDVIHWTGFTSDVNAEFAQMDLFVLPSLFGEGMPMVILEAMAAGVPVVASSVEGIPEVLENGVSGIVVKPGDPNSLAAQIGRVVGGKYDWQAMRESAYSKQCHQFSDRSMAAGVARAYSTVLNVGAGHG